MTTSTTSKIQGPAGIAAEFDGSRWSVTNHKGEWVEFTTTRKQAEQAVAELTDQAMAWGWI